MASSSLGTLTLDLIARTGGFVKGMSKAERSSKKWRRQVERDLKKLRGQFGKFAKIAAGAGVAAAGAFTILAKEGLQFVDAQAKMATRLGSTIDDLRAVQIAASDFGIEQGRLTRSLASYTKRLGDAARGTGEAQKAYEALGLEASELVNLPLPEQLALIAERISEVDSAAERTSIADRLMSGGRNMVNLFEEGGGAIRAAVQEVDDFGLSLNEIDTKRVEKANDVIGRIPRALEPIRNQIAINLAEPLIDVAELFNDAAKASNGFAAEVTEGMAIAVETIGEMISGVDDLRISLMKIQRFQLGVSAFAEQARLNVVGQGMGRMQDYGADNPPPETGPATAEYNRLDAEIRALENGSNAFQKAADFALDQAERIRSGPERRARLQEGFDAGLGDTISNDAIAAAEAVADAMSRASEAANDSADADEDKADKSDTAAKAIEDLGNASDGASRALASIAGGMAGSADPRYNIKAGGDTLEDRARARFEASAFRPGDPSVINYAPNPTARPTWSTDYLDAGVQKVNQAVATTAREQQSGGNRVPIHLTVTGKDGGEASGEGEVEAKLVEILTAASASVSPV
ncbi:hypothetical protein MKP05_09370 [Halomonas sp. EGI 63088]|uniref:Bacteriophage tail tape measure N-terminal domain-containing protein n=1 Tax=Halomonas flagellata TaxID=2920385 RepID=A0ABS9RTZ4_9GAMM|nr:hypothetical protein [Halomonas flagellata]MCH4563338.1 hypothetical protein [Halomonas flagellata]